MKLLLSDVAMIEKHKTVYKSRQVLVCLFYTRPEQVMETKQCDADVIDNGIWNSVEVRAVIAEARVSQQRALVPIDFQNG